MYTVRLSNGYETAHRHLGGVMVERVLEVRRFIERIEWDGQDVTEDVFCYVDTGTYGATLQQIDPAKRTV